MHSARRTSFATTRGGSPHRAKGLGAQDTTSELKDATGQAGPVLRQHEITASASAGRALVNTPTREHGRTERVDHPTLAGAGHAPVSQPINKGPAVTALGARASARSFPSATRESHRAPACAAELGRLRTRSRSTSRAPIIDTTAN